MKNSRKKSNKEFKELNEFINRLYKADRDREEQEEDEYEYGDPAQQQLNENRHQDITYMNRSGKW